jgi:hypothetical protein
MLLDLGRHSRPIISNSLRDFSEVHNGAKEAHCKALLRSFNYVIVTDDLGLLL